MFEQIEKRPQIQTVKTDQPPKVKKMGETTPTREPGNTEGASMKLVNPTNLPDFVSGLRQNITTTAAFNKKIPPEYSNAIAEGLQFNTSCRELVLSNGAIGDGGIVLMAQ